jgi:hypothetical protein
MDPIVRAKEEYAPCYRKELSFSYRSTAKVGYHWQLNEFASSTYSHMCPHIRQKACVSRKYLLIDCSKYKKN